MIDIKAGEIIFGEQPFLIKDCKKGYETGYNLIHSQYPKLLASLPHHTPHSQSKLDIFKAKCKRSAFAEQVAPFMQRSNVYVNQYNNRYTKLVLYLKTAKINHSCLPNASKAIRIRSSNCDDNNVF